MAARLRDACARVLWDALFAVIIAVFVVCWNIRTTAELAPAAVLAPVLVIVVSLATGALVTRVTRIELAPAVSLVFRFVCGNLVVSAALFLLSLSSPSGVVWNFALIAVV